MRVVCAVSRGCTSVQRDKLICSQPGSTAAIKPNRQFPAITAVNDGGLFSLEKQRKNEKPGEEIVMLMEYWPNLSY